MISLKDIIEKLNLESLTASPDMERPVAGGYASDLLSCVMKGAAKDCLWVTLQSHMNVVAVASLASLAGVILTEGNHPDSETIARAQKEAVVLLATPKTTFTVVGELFALGVRENA